MKNIILLIACLCISMATTAQVSEGMKYYNNGDYANALKCFKKAADQGDAEAQYGLGVCYENGYGVSKDLQEAVKWYNKAAKHGLVEAQYNLGVCYGNGYGVRKDPSKAKYWYRKAADNGLEIAKKALKNF